MLNTGIPLNIQDGRLTQEKDIRQSIDQHLNMLLTSSCHSCAADPEFGFVFNNLRFEIFNEHEGVIYNSSGNQGIIEGKGRLYEKKISGSSKNLNTFAAELKDTVNLHEKRLKDVNVSMTYIREERLIYINIKGATVENQEDYSYNTTLKVWK